MEWARCVSITVVTTAPLIMLINANDRTKARKRDGATTAMQSFLRERTI